MTNTYSRTLAFALACLFLASGVEAATTAQDAAATAAVTAPAAAAFGCDPNAPWIARRVDQNDAPRQLRAEVVLYADGCVRAIFPAPHRAAGERWTRIDRGELGALVKAWQKRGGFTLSTATLASERLSMNKAHGGDVAPQVWDAATTEIEVRHPTAKASSGPMKVYALSDQPATEHGAWDALKAIGDDLLMIQSRTFE